MHQVNLHVEAIIQNVSPTGFDGKFGPRDYAFFDRLAYNIESALNLADVQKVAIFSPRLRHGSAIADFSVFVLSNSLQAIALAYNLLQAKDFLLEQIHETAKAHFSSNAYVSDFKLDHAAVSYDATLLSQNSAPSNAEEQKTPSTNSKVANTADNSTSLNKPIVKIAEYGIFLVVVFIALALSQHFNTSSPKEPPAPSGVSQEVSPSVTQEVFVSCAPPPSEQADRSVSDDNSKETPVRIFP
jgi:hypothetical protein